MDRDDFMETEEIETVAPTTSEPSRKNITLKKSVSIKYCFNSEDEESVFSDNSMKDYFKPKSTNAVKKSSIGSIKKNATPKRVKNTFSSCDENESDSSDESSDESLLNVSVGRNRLNVKSEENLASKLAGLQCNSYSNLHTARQITARVNNPAKSGQANANNTNDKVATINTKGAKRKINTAKKNTAFIENAASNSVEAMKQMKATKTNTTKAISARKNDKVEAKKVTTEPVVKTNNIQISKQKGTTSNNIKAKNGKVNNNVKTMKINTKPVFRQNVVKGLRQIGTSNNVIDSQISNSNAVENKKVYDSTTKKANIKPVGISKNIQASRQNDSTCYSVDSQANTVEPSHEFESEKANTRQEIEINNVEKPKEDLATFNFTSRAEVVTTEKVNNIFETKKDRIKPEFEQVQAKGKNDF